MIILLANSLTIFIGAILLAAGLVKAINAKLFLNQLSNLKIIPKPLTPLITILVIEFECALGMALLINIFPENVIPSALFFLLSGFGITIIGKLNKNIHTCGCYGHVLWIPLPVSLVLNIAYIGILSWSWLFRIEGQNDYYLWQVFLIMISIAGSGFLIKQSLVKPIWDITITRPGRRFKSEWFGNLMSEGEQSQTLVVFLSNNCPVCKKWVINLNYLHDNDPKIKIIGVFNSGIDLSQKEPQESLLFEQWYLPPSRFYFLAQQFPTGILVEKEIIVKKWMIQFPAELVV
jgi:hypothetical protein